MTNELCGMFDLEVRTDLAPRGFGNHLHRCWFLAFQEDPSVGIFGGPVTKPFFSENALERYCRSAEGKAEIKKSLIEGYRDDMADDLMELIESI